MQTPPPDWQLPPGVRRGLWQMLHDSDAAADYDRHLHANPLLGVDQAFVERHCPTPGRLIDLGCGTGRLLLALAAKGYPVVGVDLSAAMLRRVGAKAAELGLTVERVQANLVQLDGFADESFDYAACLFSTLGMVSGAACRRRVVAQVWRLLRPGGVFVLHVHNRWFNGWSRAGRRWLLREGLRRLLGRGDPAGDWSYPEHDRVAGWPLHLFTRGEACRLLTDAGFVVREVRPLGLRPDGRLPWPWWFGRLRAYGYLLAARRPLGVS